MTPLCLQVAVWCAALQRSRPSVASGRRRSYTDLCDVLLKNATTDKPTAGGALRSPAVDVHLLDAPTPPISPNGGPPADRRTDEFFRGEFGLGSQEPIVMPSLLQCTVSAATILVLDLRLAHTVGRADNYDI
jgi:hypothetical protein